MPFSRHARTSDWQTFWSGRGAVLRVLAPYVTILALISLGDAIMSFSIPIHMERVLGSPALMGVVLSFSSSVGILCDFLFARWFRGKSYRFFFHWVLVATLFFPLILLLLPPWILFLLIAMATWGIYYELIGFSNIHFIRTKTQRDDHVFAWGIVTALKALAYTLGPLLAIWLADQYAGGAWLGALTFFGLAWFCWWVYWFLHGQKSQTSPVAAESSSPSFWEELRIWKTLLGKIWPLYLFFCTLSLLDATFWSIGTLLSEELHAVTPWGNFLIPAFVLPNMLAWTIVRRASQPFGKKRAAFIAGIICGTCLLIGCFLVPTPFLIGFTLLAGAAFAVAWPEICAVFEDFIARLGNSANDLAGMQNSAVSLSYILGPILAGFLASLFGSRATLGIMGGVLSAVSLFSLWMVPRKIRLPQTAITELEHSTP